MTNIKFNLKSAGYCEARKGNILKGTSNKIIKLPATYAHIVHPIHGHILFDTGYTSRFYSATKKFPFKIHAKVTKVFIKEAEEAVMALRSIGIEPEEIKYIIISHFHADHICGLRDFPNAQFICSYEAYKNVQDKKGISALKQGFIPHLMPENFDKRVQLLKIDTGQFEDKYLGKMLDLFNDGSVLLCKFEGHAKGQIGALLQTKEQKILLVSDAAWLKQSFTNNHLPSQIVRLFFDSWTNFKLSLKNINEYHTTNPDTLIIPCHCEETYKSITNDKYLDG